MTPERILTFGDFRLDPVSGHLYRGGQIVAGHRHDAELQRTHLQDL